MAWYHRLQNALRPGPLQESIERELRFHLTELEDELRAGGMSQDEAARTARARLGRFLAQRERTEAMDMALWLDSMARNVRLALRALKKAPGFTATVVVTLAISIGANSAVFSAIDAVLLRPLPFPDGDQLMLLRQVNPRSPETFVAPVRVRDWNGMSASFLAITGYGTEDASETSAELPERVKRAFVAPRFLQVLGISPALGRDFIPSEEKFGGPSARSGRRRSHACRGHARLS
jgi:hypothetical protein